MEKQIFRGDIFNADLSGSMWCEQSGVRPVLVLQNNTGNKYSPTVIVAAITSRLNKAKLPTHVMVKPHESGLQKDSIILFEQIRTLDKRRLKEHIGRINENKIVFVNYAIAVSFGLQLANARQEQIS